MWNQQENKNTDHVATMSYYFSVKFILKIFPISVHQVLLSKSFTNHKYGFLLNSLCPWIIWELQCIYDVHSYNSIWQTNQWHWINIVWFITFLSCLYSVPITIPFNSIKTNGFKFSIIFHPRSCTPYKTWLVVTKWIAY